MQRANYGIPARQSAMQAQPMSRPAAPMTQPVVAQPQVAPVTPIGQAARAMQPLVAAPPQPAAPAAPQPTGRYMDMAGPVRQQQPTPTQPQPAPMQQPVAATQAPTRPTMDAMQPAAAQQSQAPRPLFTNSPQPAAPKEATKLTKSLPKLRLGFAVAAAILVLVGGGRLITAGSTTGNNIAVGAVAANDGHTMTIQFTADDGKMHKFTSKSSASLIPGTAVEIAYRSGAPEASAKRVSVIKQAHNIGLAILSLGIVLFIGLGLWFFARAMKNIDRNKPKTSLTTPVTA